MKLSIRHYLEDPDPVLSVPCEPCNADDFGQPLVELGNALIDLLASEPTGVGLAAPQASVMKRIFVMEYRDSPIVCCNPTLRLYGPEVLGQEGCLSVPDVFNQVSRFQNVFLKYVTPQGEHRSLELEGFDARVAQHEYDHLDGIMFFDRLASRQMRKATLRDWEGKKKRLSAKAGM